MRRKTGTDNTNCTLLNDQLVDAGFDCNIALCTQLIKQGANICHTNTYIRKTNKDGPYAPETLIWYLFGHYLDGSRMYFDRYKFKVVETPCDGYTFIEEKIHSDETKQEILKLIIYCLENGCKHFISDSKSGFDKDFNLFLLCLKLENKKNNRLTKLCLKDNSSLETLNSSHITRSYGGGSSNESGLYMAILKGDFEITKLMIDKWNSNININVKKR